MTSFRFIPAEVPPYSFCESVTGVGPWHIRKTTDAGLRLGCGIDTLALCGGCQLGGWDLNVRITGAHLSGNYVCRSCRELYVTESGGGK